MKKSVAAAAAVLTQSVQDNYTVTAVLITFSFLFASMHACTQCKHLLLNENERKKMRKPFSNN